MSALRQGRRLATPMRLKAPFGLLIGLILAGCEMQSGGTTSTRLVERDIEAPEILDFKEVAQWDGRPSSGGVWASSSRGGDPQRVLLRNEANGKFVIGSLFSHAGANKGLRISADAAGALGLAASTSQSLRVTALRPQAQSAALPQSPSKPILDSNIQVAAFESGTLAPAPKTIAASKPQIQPALQAPAQAMVQVPAPTPAKTAAASGQTIQIGFFSIEANAQRAKDILAKSGITADIRQENLRGKTSWVVTARGDGAKLNQIKAAGFADAYVLK